MTNANEAITLEQWHEMYGNGRKRNKYGATKTTIDGITFASGLEARRYQELKLLERAGEIHALQLQPRFELQPAFKHDGKTIRAIHYVADFQYVITSEGKLIIEDTKGKETPAFKLKRKMFLFHYPHLELRIVK